jgi:hypothetical protein
LAVRPFFVTERSIGNPNRFSHNGGRNPGGLTTGRRPEGSHYRVDGTKERLTRDRDNDYDPAWQPIR